MSDTARDYQNSTSPDTNGLDDLFALMDAPVKARDANAVGIGREPDANATSFGRVLDTNFDSCVSVEKAAEKLNLSIRAIQKRLKRGTLKGQKIKHGASERWMVDLSELVGPNEGHVLDGDFVSVDLTSALREQEDANALEIGRELDANSANLDANIVAIGRELDANLDAGCEQGTFDTIQTQYQDLLIKELQSKLEGATFRIGYLQHQLECQEKEIKLLTDSQHKSSWWSNFSNWFLGR